MAPDQQHTGSKDRWAPANQTESLLEPAFTAQDHGRCQELLRDGLLYFPLTESEARGETEARWQTYRHEDGSQWVVCYTSREQMETATGGAFVHARTSTFTGAVGNWPDQTCGMFINPGLPIQFAFTPATVARIAALTIEQRLVAVGKAVAIAVQKPVRVMDVENLLKQSDPRVSGFVHCVTDLAGLDEPTDLAGALALPVSEYISGDGSLYFLRWFAYGSEPYRRPFGGTDEQQRTAVDGWVIEEPPFRGMGYGGDPDTPVQEYLVNGVLLPYMAELWEILPGGREKRRATYDADRRRWMLVMSVDDYVELDNRLAEAEEESGTGESRRTLQEGGPDEGPSGPPTSMSGGA